MRRLAALIAVLVAALVWSTPLLASPAGGVATVELSARPGGVFATSSRIPEFTLAGVQWRGSGHVRLRTRSTDGRWSPWRSGAPEAEDGPDPLSEEGSRSGWRVGNPWWVGPSDRIEVRALGSVTQVRAKLVWSPDVRIPYRRLAVTESPAIVPRATWGANESIRRDAPTLAREVRFAIVHHTAGTNDYTRSEAPAIVRGIQLYHVQGNGWNDIGYNFLVDRFGTVYEGRFGGVDRNVVGAHAQGFNTGSVGIAVLGTYGRDPVSRAAQEATTRLIAWRLDLAHADPTGVVQFVSGGSDRFPIGAPAQLRAVSGHRDTGLTECPGDALYSRLGAIASEARSLGGQKVFEPNAEAAGPEVRFRARLSFAGQWSVVVTAADGSETARGSGSTTAVDWTWDSSSVAAGTYFWSISAGSALPATGTVRAGAAATPLEVAEVAAEPAAITPNGDGQADSAVVSYRLSVSASVSIEITDELGGLVSTVSDRVWTRAGKRAATIAGDALPDGRYVVTITASVASGESARAALPLVVSRTLGLVDVGPATFSPNGDGRSDELVVTFSLAAPAAARVRIEREGRWVATVLSESLPAGPQRVVWDGSRPGGVLRDGSFVATVDVEDGVGVTSFGVPFVVDTAAPQVRILPGRGIRLEVSEPSVLWVRVAGKTMRREVTRAGVVRIPWAGEPVRVRVVAEDLAGNRSPPVIRSRPGKGQPGQ